MGKLVDKVSTVENADTDANGIDGKDVDLDVDELPADSRGETIEKVTNLGKPSDTNRKINSKCMAHSFYFRIFFSEYFRSDWDDSISSIK